jgi:hypothetical protein
MNTTQIERCVRRMCRDKFQGVFSCDTLPPKPKLLVCNTDPHDKPGTHWIAIYVDKWGRGEYFDSFGMEPTAVFKDYMNKHCRYWTFNRKKLQSVLSRFCGHYCCFYCVYRYNGFSMNKIVSMFTKDTTFNDVLVHKFVCR